MFGLYVISFFISIASYPFTSLGFLRLKWDQEEDLHNHLEHPLEE
jgi:hypothetical protein